VTANQGLSHQLKCQEAGMVGFFNKPLPFNIVIKAIA
jgi:CheY-like chemotaxis protein